jgi:hypothetical protein
MKHTITLAITATILIGALRAAAAPQPNVIVILGDDMGLDSVSDFNPKMGMNTPAIDRLASEGISFMDAHSTSYFKRFGWDESQIKNTQRMRTPTAVTLPPESEPN